MEGPGSVDSDLDKGKTENSFNSPLRDFLVYTSSRKFHRKICSNSTYNNKNGKDELEQNLVCFEIVFIYLGVELLKKFKGEFAKFEKDRQELANAEKLFDLPITMYPEMQQMEKELKGLELIYRIYEKQKVCGDRL